MGGIRDKDLSKVNAQMTRFIVSEILIIMMEEGNNMIVKIENEF
jgi:hypothetical protein